MMKGIKVLGIVILVILVLTTSAFFFIKSREVPSVAVAEVNLANIEDGNYIGEYSEGLVKVTVETIVKNNKIKNIVIKEHENWLGGKAEVIVDEIIRNQSLEVEVISGATLSSNVIRRAVEESLRR